MKILSLDTTMAACSAAVVDTVRAQPLAQVFLTMERGHAEALAPMVSEVMGASGLDYSEIDRIAVTIGPGTFTGVRVGLAFARGLGLARSIPVIGIDSLSAIAANETAPGAVLVASDARNGEIYAACFDVERNPIFTPRITTPSAVAKEVPAHALIVGSAAGAILKESSRSDLLQSSAGNFPVAGKFAHLAAAAPAGAMPAPLYLRAPDAKPQPVTMRKPDELIFQSVSEAAAPLLAAIHAEAFEFCWSSAAFEGLLRMPGAQATIALELDQPAAFLLMRRAADETEVISIATRPHAQRRGVARQLLAHGLEEQARQGARYAFLEVAASNAAALRLYLGLGFQAAGLRKDYYQKGQGKEDAIVMRKELST